MKLVREAAKIRARDEGFRKERPRGIEAPPGAGEGRQSRDWRARGRGSRKKFGHRYQEKTRELGWVPRSEEKIIILNMQKASSGSGSLGWKGGRGDGGKMQ